MIQVTWQTRSWLVDRGDMSQWTEVEQLNGQMQLTEKGSFRLMGKGVTSEWTEIIQVSGQR